MSIFKKRESTPFINLNATFDTRSSNEVLNIGGETEKLVCYNLENSDEFLTYSISTRNGTQDLSGGLVNTSWVVGTILNTDGNPTVLPADVNYQNVNFNVSPQISPISNTFPSWGNILIPSGNFNLYSGNVFVQGTEATPQQANAEMLLPVEVELYVYALNQNPLHASGAGYMQDQNSPANIRNIAMSGTFLGNTTPYPRFLNTKNISTPDLPQPIAISDKSFVDFGNYSGNASINWNSAVKEIPFKFTAPYPMSSGNVYFAMPKFTLDSTATKNRNFRIIAAYTPVLAFQQPDDLYPNAILAQVSGSSTTTFPLSLLDPANDITNTKLWLKTDIKNYVSGTQFVVENPTVNITDFAMFDMGSSSPSGSQHLIASGSVLNGLVETPFNTTTVPFGQIITIPSGLHTIYGGYFYANTYSGYSFYNTNGGTNNYAYYTRDLGNWNPSAYTVDYVTSLSEIVSSSGSVASGLSIISGINTIATFTGTYTFTNPVDKYVAGINYNLEKIYGLFDTPLVLSGATNTDYLLSFKFLKQGTDELIDDYTRNYFYTNPVSVTNIISSPFLIGLNSGNLYSGTYVTNQKGDDEYTWSQYNNSGLVGGTYDLGCGLVTVPDDNAITLIHDLRNPSSKNQKIIYGYSDKLAYSTFANPNKTSWTTLWSGATVNNDALWSAITWNRNGNTLLLADQYAQSSGVSWDTAYSGLGYHWGKRPTFTGSVVTSGNYTSPSTLVSGTYNVLLAVSMQSGGFRASELMASGVKINNLGEWISVSGLNMSQQYPFDLNLDATNIFITDANGSEYFQATLFSGTSLTGTIYPQPITNSIGQVYIGQALNVTSGITVLNTLEPPRPEEYLTSQINRPAFKKVIPFFAQVIAAGKSDEQATLFYSPINEPTIWGVDGFYSGRIPLPDTDEAITGLEKFRQYLICFTTNKTFRIEFDATGGIPLSVVPINSIYGSVGFFATVSTDQGVYTLSTEGPIFCNGQASILIGQEIMPWFLQLSHTDLQFSFALHNIPKSTITWSIGKDSENASRNFGLTYNYKEKTWIIRHGQNWNVGEIVRDADDFEQIWIGDRLGEVKREDVGDLDTDTLFNDGNDVSLTKGIQLLVETPWMTMKDSNDRKLFRFLSVDAEQVTGVRLKIDVYFDYATTASYTRYIDLDSNNPNKRVNLGGNGRLIKFIISNVGIPAKVKINKLRIDFQDLGNYKPAW